MQKEISVNTSERNQMVDITSIVGDAVASSGIKNGHCFIFCPHTTASITINENSDPDVQADFLGYLQKLVPASSNFSHAEGNSDAHIKSSLVGNFQLVLFRDGKLLLGRWQAVFFCEFDGPRQRKIIVDIAGE